MCVWQGQGEAEAKFTTVGSFLEAVSDAIGARGERLESREDLRAVVRATEECLAESSDARLLHFRGAVFGHRDPVRVFFTDDCGRNEAATCFADCKQQRIECVAVSATGVLGP